MAPPEVSSFILCCPTAGASAIEALPAWLFGKSDSAMRFSLLNIIMFQVYILHFTRVRPQSAPVLYKEIAVLLVKDAIKPVPRTYFIEPKKSGELIPILEILE